MVNIHTLRNGLTLIVEHVPHVESAAYDLIIPGGIIGDDPDRIGASLVLAELTSRGAGPLDARQLSDAFDGCGIRHSEAAGHGRFSFRGSLLAEHLDKALSLLALTVRDPLLPQGELEGVKNLFLLDIAALVDNPARKSLIELAARYYPAPYNRSSLGTADGIRACGINELRQDWHERFRPQGSVLSVAGNVEDAKVIASVERHFGDWQGTAQGHPKFGSYPARDPAHLESESAQLQIALAFPSAAFGDAHYYAAKVASGILSGGMFGRLFVEVREKRGLCYSVFARHSATKDYGTVFVYAGTTPERAHETLNVIVTELKGLAGTVIEDELKRAKSNLKSSLVIAEESSSSRAASNAGDWFLDRRVRGLDEISSAIDAVSVNDVDHYCTRFPPDSKLLLTLGSKRLH